MVRNRFIANKYPQISEGMLTDSNNYNFTDQMYSFKIQPKKKRHTHKLASQIKFTFRKGISV
jgi:hypothetical protein